MVVFRGWHGVVLPACPGGPEFADDLDATEARNRSLEVAALHREGGPGRRQPGPPPQTPNMAQGQEYKLGSGLGPGLREVRILGHMFFEYPQNKSQLIDSPDPISTDPVLTVLSSPQGELKTVGTSVDIGRSHPNPPGALSGSPGKHTCCRTTGWCPGASARLGHSRGTDGLSRCLEGFSGLSAADSGLNSLYTRPSGIWGVNKIISEYCLCSSNFSCATASHAEEATVLPLPPVVSDIIAGLDLGSTPEMTLFGTPNRIGPLTSTASAESTERNFDYGGTVSKSIDPVLTVLSSPQGELKVVGTGVNTSFSSNGPENAAMWSIGCINVSNGSSLEEEKTLVPRGPISVLDYEDPADHFGSQQEEDSLRPFEVCDPSGNGRAPLGALRVGDTQSVQTDQLYSFSEVAHKDEVGERPNQGRGLRYPLFPTGNGSVAQVLPEEPAGESVGCQSSLPNLGDDAVLSTPSAMDDSELRYPPFSTGNGSAANMLSGSSKETVLPQCGAQACFVLSQEADATDSPLCFRSREEGVSSLSTDTVLTVPSSPQGELRAVDTRVGDIMSVDPSPCLLYTSDAADE